MSDVFLWICGHSPYVIVGFSALSSIGYYCDGNVAHGTYWAAAAALNVSVLYMA
jgi:hypothetical protein